MKHIEQSFQELKEKIKQYNPNCNFWLLEKAFNLALVAHTGQMRVSGEPFVMHPIMVAHILAEMELDIDSITAALLHDVVEDTRYNYEDICELFGQDIAELVEGVTKLGKIPYSTKEEQQAENLRKMFLAMAKDIRVVLIKLADRLHNMRSLTSMPDEKRREKACETLEIYAPLAHRLGISKIKWELEDLSLRFLDPIAYKEITEKIAEKRNEREKSLETIKKLFQEKLSLLGIKAEIEGRAKHFYSIYRKMFAQNTPIDQIYDLLAVRIIVDTISDCYSVLGMVHELYKPIPGRFKDYIAMPKNNMYQSLHTTMIGPEGKPFEVQIRTWEMHKIAEVGIAAHWKYKEGKSGQSELDDKLEWVRQLLDIHQDYDDSQDFVKSLKIDLFEDDVFVFSPKGDVLDLPLGSTPIDFAYMIHSAIGNKTMGAKVNGRIVPLEYQLQNGDIVEILTSSMVHGPSRDWLKIVKTNQAKKKINEWFKKENREENIMRGKEIFEREMKRINIQPTDLSKLNWKEQLFKKYSLNNMDDFYAALGYGTLGINKVVSRIKVEYSKITEPKDKIKLFQPKKSTKPSSHGVIVKGIDNCLVKLSRCCNPVYGDEIVGYITRGRGVSVHRMDCVNVRNLTDPTQPEHERYIDVWWDGETETKYISDIQIVSNDRERLMIDITNAVVELKTTLIAMNARKTKNDLAVINLTIEITSKEQMERVIKKFKSIPGVTSVIRAKH